jgi:hypothetical protein
MKTKRKAIRMVGVTAKMTWPIVLCVYLMFHDVRLILQLCLGGREIERVKLVQSGIARDRI